MGVKGAKSQLDSPLLPMRA